MSSGVLLAGVMRLARVRPCSCQDLLLLLPCLSGPAGSSRCLSVAGGVACVACRLAFTRDDLSSLALAIGGVSSCSRSRWRVFSRDFLGWLHNQRRIDATGVMPDATHLAGPWGAFGTPPPLSLPEYMRARVPSASLPRSISRSTRPFSLCARSRLLPPSAPSSRCPPIPPVLHAHHCDAHTAAP